MRRLNWAASVLAAALAAVPAAQAAAPADTTIAGRDYALITAEELLDLMGAAEPGAQLVLRETAVQGRVSSLAADLDTVAARLEFSDLRFLDEVLLTQVVFTMPVTFRRTTFAGDLSLAEAWFQGDFALRECQVDGKTNFRDARFAAAADFTESHLAAAFNGAGARFATVTFMRLRCQGGVYLENARFAGPADFSEAVFGDIASFKDAHWEAPVTFVGTRLIGRSFFWKAHFAAADFSQARFARETSFKQAEFNRGATFAGVVFGRAAHFEQVRFDAGATFDGSAFAGPAVLAGTHSDGDLLLNAIFRANLDLRHLVAPVLDLRPSAATPDSLLAPGAGLLLQNARVDRLFASWSQLRGHLAQPPDESGYGLDRVYAVLRHQFLSAGMAADARACHVEALDQRRRHLSWTAPERHALTLFDLTSRYGTDLQRLAMTAIVWVGLFALLYRWMPPGERPFGFVECLVFSLHTFLNTGAAAAWPAGKVRFLALFQALTGWIFLALLVAVLLSLLPR